MLPLSPQLLKGPSQKSIASKPKSSQISGLQCLHQLTCILATMVESLDRCLNSITVADEDHSANLTIHQLGLAIQALATDDKSHLT